MYAAHHQICSITNPFLSVSSHSSCLFKGFGSRSTVSGAVCIESMDVLDNGSVLRLRNHDGNPAQLRSAFVPVPGATPEFGRKRRSGDGESSPPGSDIKRVWSIAKRVKREISSDFCLHGRIVEALLRSQGEEGATYRIEARVDNWGGSKGVDAEREQLKSGNVRPWRFMYFEKGEWVEFCEEANSVAWERYRSGNLTAEIRVANRVYLLNFSDMTQTNLSTGYVRSIAWIGDAWQVSLPANPIASPSEKSQLGSRIIRHRTTWRDGATDSISNLFLGPDGTGDAPDDHSDAKGDHELTKLTLGVYGGVSPCLSEVTKKPAVLAALEEKSSPPGSSFGQRLVKLELETPEADDVKRKFLSGFGNTGDGSMITAIHRDASSTAAVRAEAFERQRALTEQTRGYSNVRFAWHGTSKKGVTGIFLHGFGQPRTPKNGCVYGVGVYLAVENQSFVSALYADNDENGEQHVVLCKVVAGASELVKPPSEQFHPSSEHFDTGVDDLHAPKRLIVWSTHMNTHILPLYVVSFKLPSRWHGMLTGLNNKHRGFSAFCHKPPMRHPHCAKQTSDMVEGLRKPSEQQGPTSPFIRFPSLMRVLQRFLSVEQRVCLKEMYSKFEVGMMDRKGFVNEILKMVGKPCLIQAIQNCQGLQGCHGASVFKAP